jgi:phosphatidate cytidylyltransferase
MNTLIARLLTGFVLGIIFWITFIYLPPVCFSLLILAILIIIVLKEWPNFFKTNDPWFWLLMPLYPILPFLLIILMNSQSIYRPLVFLLFVVVPSHDTGAYVTGKLLGRYRIAPSISPAKTWEGFWGGFICAWICLIFFLWQYGKLPSWWIIGLVALAMSTVASMGDLFESWLKRRANIKDSGSLLPGHGGFLDRFDGMLGAVFLLYGMKNILITLFELKDMV